jgi:hypothetical protein
MTDNQDIKDHITRGKAWRAMNALVPFWDALDHAGQRDDYQTITEALRVLRGHIEAKGEQ